MISVKIDKCDFCGTCVAVCPVDAIELKASELIISESACIDCYNCVYVCPFEVLEGYEITV